MWLMVWLFLSGVLTGAETLALGRHLFLDARLIESEMTSGVQRRMTPPKQIRRVLKPDQPWEELGFIFYSTVIDHEGTAMLYYGCYDGKKGKHLALATSRDGLRWTRPKLNLTEFKGSRQNNLFPMEAVEAGVFIDPAADPDGRFEMLHNRNWPDPKTAGVYLSHSQDGVHWRQHEVRLFPRVPDSQPSAFWDPSIHRHVIYLRAWDPKRSICRVAPSDLESPWSFDESVPPKQVWGKDKVATIGRELPIVMRPDDRDPENVHLYTSTVFRYPWAHNAYFAFPAAYFHFTGKSLRPRALDGNDGTFDAQLAVSRDGISWERFREPWVEPDHIDGLTLQLVSMGTGIIRRGRELHQYFVGWPHTHNRPVEWDRNMADREASKQRDLGGIYCATSRLDGFVAMAAGNEGGVLTTRSFNLEGDQLRLNIDTSGTGSATVAILNEKGIPLIGHDHSDCEVIHNDSVDHLVRWKSGPTITSNGKDLLRIQVRMRNTELWALELAKAE